MIQTTDTFYPLVADPFLYGRYCFPLLLVVAWWLNPVTFWLLNWSLKFAKMFIFVPRIACASLLSAVYAAGVTSVDNVLCHLAISTRCICKLCLLPSCFPMHNVYFFKYVVTVSFLAQALDTVTYFVSHVFDSGYSDIFWHIL